VQESFRSRDVDGIQTAARRTLKDNILHGIRKPSENSSRVSHEDASIFDAYYAATALSSVPDHTIISTDVVFDKVSGLKRVDPRNL
jgi:hypothetical protein